MTLSDIVLELDRRAPEFEIGKLQALRKTLKRLKRAAGSSVFGKANDDSWAFHRGGRDELQFNVGVESMADRQYF